MQGYTAREIAKMLDLSVAQVRSLARGGFIQPRRGDRGEYRFSFQELVLLRTAKGLKAARVPQSRIRRALSRLRKQLPDGRPLTGLKIAAAGDEVVVRDGRRVWNPESGQTMFDFEVSELAQRVKPLAQRAAQAAFQSAEDLSSDDWFELGCELETSDPENARAAYLKALELEPRHPPAHVNLGRLMHEAGYPASAEEHYRMALEMKRENPTALYNLGVALEDLGRDDQAIEAYDDAIRVDPTLADAHYNLARIHERRGEVSAALRHFNTYRRLTRS